MVVGLITACGFVTLRNLSIIIATTAVEGLITACGFVC